MERLTLSMKSIIIFPEVIFHCLIRSVKIFLILEKKFVYPIYFAITIIMTSKKCLALIHFPKWLEGKWKESEGLANDILYMHPISNSENMWEISIFDYSGKQLSFEMIKASSTCIDLFIPSKVTELNYRHRFTIDTKRKRLNHTNGEYLEFYKTKNLPSPIKKFSWLLGHWQHGETTLKITRPLSKNTFSIELKSSDGEKAIVKVLKQSNLEIELIIYFKSTKNTTYSRITFNYLEKKVFLYLEMNDFYSKENNIKCYDITIINKSKYIINSCFSYLENEKYPFFSDSTISPDKLIFSIPMNQEITGENIKISLHTDKGIIDFFIKNTNKETITLYNDKIVSNKKSEIYSLWRANKLK